MKVTTNDADPATYHPLHATRLTLTPPLLLLAVLTFNYPLLAAAPTEPAEDSVCQGSRFVFGGWQETHLLR